MIETICQNCGTRKVFEDDKIGKKYKCPTCGTAVTIERIKAASSMESEVTLDVKEIKMTKFEKWIVSRHLLGILIGGFFSIFVFYLIVGLILSGLGFDMLKAEEHGGEHETFGLIFWILITVGGIGYMIYLKYFKKY